MTVNDPRQESLQLDWSKKVREIKRPRPKRSANPHLLPPAPKKINRTIAISAFGYAPKGRAQALILAKEQANTVGHSMTRFMFDQRDGYVRSKCRKCGLKLRDWNFQIDGPALEYECLYIGKVWGKDAPFRKS